MRWMQRQCRHHCRSQIQAGLPRRSLLAQLNVQQPINAVLCRLLQLLNVTHTVSHLMYDEQSPISVLLCRFLLYLAFIPAFVGLCSLPFVNFVPYTQKSELDTQSHFCTTGYTARLPALTATTKHANQASLLSFHPCSCCCCYYCH